MPVPFRSLLLASSSEVLVEVSETFRIPPAAPSPLSILSSLSEFEQARLMMARVLLYLSEVLLSLRGLRQLHFGYPCMCSRGIGGFAFWKLYLTLSLFDTNRCAREREVVAT